MGAFYGRQHPATGWEHFSAKPIAMRASALSAYPPTPILPVEMPHRVARCTCKRRRIAFFIHFSHGSILWSAAAPYCRMGALFCKAHSHGSFGTVNPPTDTHSACENTSQGCEVHLQTKAHCFFCSFSHGSILFRQHPAAGWEHLPIVMGASVCMLPPPSSLSSSGCEGSQ
jgi:hypothetical protein